MNTECQLHKIYAWRRFWVRADTELLLEDEAYLPDPEGDFSRFMNRGVGTLAEASDDLCSIRLGEPGIGKSKSLQADFDKLVHIWAAAGEGGALIDIGAVASLTDLRTLLLANDNVRRWRDGVGIFHLCLDSLDEALPNYPGLPKALMSVIQELPKERVRLLIACRAGEFPPYLYESFEAHFGPRGVSRWYMAPLRQKDVHLAATENNLDGDGFLRAVREREAQPLAARPITLDLLLGEATSGSELLPDIWRLYERGCGRMLSERFDSSRFTQAPTLEPSQKMAVAGRIACVTIFGAFTTVEISSDVAKHTGAVEPEDIAGGQEIGAGASFPVSSSEVHEVLKTGVFTASGLTFRWLHKTYGEFLAAYHLRSHAISKNQVISLIGCAGRVAPALRGVTAWLTSKDEDVFRQVLQLDPEVLLFSDLSTATDQQRAELVDWLLREARANNPLVHEWGMFWTYRKLKHTGLRSQLEPIIERSTSAAERFCAIQIAEACSGAGLSTLLTDLVLREGEQPHLRIAAAACVADHGDEVDKVRLLPVALQVSKNDEEERLEAQALSAVWPAHCTWAQIRDSLGAGDPQTTTPLGRFLGFDFAEGLPPSDLAEALDWLAEKNCYPDGLSGWAAATDQLLMRASAIADDPAVRRATVGVLFARLSKHHKTFYESGTKKDDGIMPWSPSARRAIAVELIPRLAPNAYLAISALRSSNPLLVQGDIEFMMGRWEIAAADEKLVWQAAIAWMVDWRDPEASSTVLTMSVERYPGLQPILETQQQAVLSHLDREQEEREQQEAARRRCRDERIIHIHDLLNRAATETKAFSHLVWVLSFPLDEDYAAPDQHPSLRELPGWQALTADEKERLMSGGKLFLETERTYASRGLRRGGPTRNSTAGYRLLRELVERDPVYVDNLPIETWERWIPAIILFQSDLPDNLYGGEDRKLLRLAAAKSMDRLTRTLAIALRQPRIYGAERQLRRVSDELGCEVFDARISGSVLRHRMPPRTYLAAMRGLVECSHPDAIKVLQEALPRVPLASADELSRLALDAALWIETSQGAAWPEAFAQMQARPGLAPLLLDVPGPEGKAFDQIVRWLSDEQLGDLYLWLRKQFGPAPNFPVIPTEPQWTSQGKSLAGLQQRRRVTSVATLERIESACPEDWQVRKATWDAKRLLVEASWEPLGPAEVKRIVEDRRQLLVRDEEELIEAVWEALHDYQSQIRGEGSQVMRLWNEPVHTPKPEEPLSREIGAEIQRVLATRGVKITHEVKIREGQFVDIHVSAVTSNSKRRLISLIIEVKGCWHRELKTAIDTQLSMRYLKDNEAHFGIYLAVWFLCDEWDGREDGRKKNTPQYTLAEIRAFLDDQANAVNAKTQSTIRALVLDATIEGSGPELAPSAKKRSRSAKKSQTTSGAAPA
jgi:hypothetical protein